MSRRRRYQRLSWNFSSRKVKSLINPFSQINIININRISLSLLLLHSLMLIVLFPRSQCSKSINHSCFLLKFFIVLGTSIGFLFIPNDYMKAYVYISMAVSFIFLIFQMVALIDFSYYMSNILVRRYHAGDKMYGVILIFCSLVFLTLNIVLLYFHFASFWLPGSSN